MLVENYFQMGVWTPYKTVMEKRDAMYQNTLF